MNKLIVFALAVGILPGAASRAATPPSIEDFASRPKIEDVSISPDGRYLAMIQTLNGRGAAVVMDRQGGRDSPMLPVLTEPEHFRFTWCHWATNTRLLCGLHALVRERMVYGISRLVAVDADGKNTHVLMQNTGEAQGQYQDEIINWDSGPPNTVLIEADQGVNGEGLGPSAKAYGEVGTHGLPAVFELNVMSGQLSVRQHAREPIRHWITDKHGVARLGFGYSGTTISYWTYLEGDSNWRRLIKFDAFSRENHFRPFAISDE